MQMPTASISHSPATSVHIVAATPGILVVDDDAIFRDRLTRAFAGRGYVAYPASNHSEAIALARKYHPQRAVVDMRMPGKGGLEVVRDLAQIDENMQILVLTGYGSIATAVEAVRLGALDYLTKPADADQILNAYEKTDAESAPDPSAVEVVPTLARVEWEHIQRILNDCGGNISRTARTLGIHRRSLQRKLSKLPPLE